MVLNLQKKNHFYIGKKCLKNICSNPIKKFKFGKMCKKPLKNIPKFVCLFV